MSKIESLRARQILNSRGDWTIEVTVRASGGVEANASVPQGESRGSHEAVSLPADQAIKNILEIIGPVLKESECVDQAQLDARLIELDGTATKERLGGNALLGVSMAYARLMALSENLPLWQYLRNISGLELNSPTPPRLLALMVEGGLHAPGASPFQEYLVLPRGLAITQSIDIVTRIYQSLRQIVSERFGPAATRLGDEGAFAPPTTQPLEPFNLIIAAGQAVGLAETFDVGLDAAANNTPFTAEELMIYYRQMRSTYPLCYLEDPFKEDDFIHSASFLAESNKEMMIVGDDLTVTNIERMKIAQAERSVNAMIIKPNQIGTVTETLKAARQARRYGWRITVSHRGQETNDDFIADLAWGIGADGIKLGAPTRGERVSKYNRLLEIAAQNR